MTEQGTVASTPNDSSVGAEVNTPQQVKLYNPAGRSITVDADDVSFWAAQGFSAQTFDIDTLENDISQYFDGAKGAVLTLVANSKTAEDLDTSPEGDMHVASMAMEQLITTYAQITTGINARLPVRQEHGIEPEQVPAQEA